MRCVCILDKIHYTKYFMNQQESSDDDGSDDTEGTLTHLISSDDSESDEDDTESLASSVAELSSGVFLLNKNTLLLHILFYYVLLEINLKQQLVDQLEKAQRSFQTMRTQYEDKMQLLQHQIKSIESERDRVLKDMSRFFQCQWFTLLTVRYRAVAGTQRAMEKSEEKAKENKGEV